MPRVRDLLYRFRPAGAPGAASAAGVPANHDALVEAELDGVFAELATTERECAVVVDTARRDAAARRSRAEQEARAIVAAAESRRAEERRRAAACYRQALAAELARSAAEAETMAGIVRGRGMEQLGEYVARIVREVDRLVGAGSGGGGG